MKKLVAMAKKLTMMGGSRPLATAAYETNQLERNHEMTRKLIMAVATLAAAICAFADAPSISNVKAQQRYPWNGLVDIDIRHSENCPHLRCVAVGVYVRILV